MYENVLNELVSSCKAILSKNLVGIYLHGSYTMGCFNPKKSDLDFLIVVEHPMTDAQKKALMYRIVSLNPLAPIKGLEFSVVQKEYCEHFRYPTPFELHFSTMHLDWYRKDPNDYIQKMNGEDTDLAAHFVMIRARGLTLYGTEIRYLFGEVPMEDYLDSIKLDVENAEQEIRHEPLYLILNLCRVLGYIRTHKILSKKEGAEWALQVIDPMYTPLVQQALDCYTSDRTMSINLTIARAYCNYMLNQIHS